MDINSAQAMLWGVLAGGLLWAPLGWWLATRRSEILRRRLMAKMQDRYQQRIQDMADRESDCVRACRGMRNPVKTVDNLKATAVAAFKAFGVFPEDLKNIGVRV